MQNKNIYKLLLFLIPGLILIPPILEKTRGLHSPIITSYAIGCLIVSCTIVGLLLITLDRAKWQNNRYLSVIKATIIAIIVFSYVDIGFDGKEILAKILPASSELGDLARVSFKLAIVGFSIFIIAAIIWKFESDAVTVLAVLFGTVFLSTLFISGQKAPDNWAKPNLALGKNAATKPTEVFIILDGMIGAAGIDPSIPGGKELHFAVTDFHKRHGFRLFGGAYSRHYYSKDSIPNIMNFNYTNLIASNDMVHEPFEDQFEMLNNKLFDKIHDSGRFINVYQTPYLNFCNHTSVRTCKTTPHHDPFNEYVSKEFETPIIISITAAIKKVTRKSLTGDYASSIATRLLRVMHKESDLYPIIHNDKFTKYNSLTFDKLWDTFQEEVIKSNRGSIFFAHFVFPHAPYDLDKNCRPKSFRTGTGRAILENESGLHEDELRSNRQKYYKEYIKQAHCTYKKLDEFVKNLKKSPKLDDATIVLLGDHGSRISAGITVKFLKERDFIDNYSTLFSVRHKDQTPGYDRRMISVQQLLGALQSDQLDNLSSETENTVSVQTDLNDEQGRTLVPMPQF